MRKKESLKEVFIMEIGEIISDAIKYPLNNMKALLIYIVLSIIIMLMVLKRLMNGFLPTTSFLVRHGMLRIMMEHIQK